MVLVSTKSKCRFTGNSPGDTELLMSNRLWRLGNKLPQAIFIFISTLVWEHMMQANCVCSSSLTRGNNLERRGPNEEWVYHLLRRCKLRIQTIGRASGCGLDII